jgi:hypothetical protein
MKSRPAKQKATPRTAKSQKSKAQTIKVDAIARVEGEGGMLIRLKDGKVTEVKVNIY